MKVKEQKYWVHVKGAVCNSDFFQSKEEAIADGLKEYGGEPFLIGQPYFATFEEQDISVAGQVIENMMSALEQTIGEASQQWEVTSEEEADLEAMITRTVMRWLNKHNLHPSCYVVRNTETVTPERKPAEKEREQTEFL